MTKSLNVQNQKKISIVDLSGHYRTIQAEVEKAVCDVLSSGSYILGQNVQKLESELAEYLDSKHVITCANGTDAIVLSLMALGIKLGDEVITVSHSFFATSEAIALVGAKPVFVDIKEDDFNIDVSKIEKAITKNTKAIIPVHLYGQACEISSVIDVARKHNLYVVEDCAQAVGAKFHNKKVGTFGDTGTISFFPTKNLGAFGDGGAVCTNSDDVAQKIRQLRVHGSSKRYVHDYIGLNSRLDEVQAAILRIGLKYLDEWNTKRQNAAKYYDLLFENVPEVITPRVKPNCNHVFHQYTIRVKNRDLLCEKLQERNIESIIYYPIPIHLQNAFKYLGCKAGYLLATEGIADEILSLPMYPVITRDVQELVVESIKDILRK